MVLTKYADDFKESIKYKVNIKIEENKFHENVPAPRIVVKSDADRRSAYIELLCNEATAHKMAVLFIKEFDLLINKFEDYFKIIGLKLYYLLPRIDKDRMKNTLDNYNFEAYIPTLIPLLTGDNIYSSKVVFARELIQNSIDAISVREAKDEKDFSKEILIELKRDENGKRYFKIVDRGTGMDRYKIERYFTSIGRSFYSGEEYEDLNISYKPISNFGIGFLSSFMVCQEIDVKTRYYIDGSEGLKLHIPNYDGCFFIELEKDSHIGTELKLYLNDVIDDRSIVDYIRKVMQDIKYPIVIRFLNEKGGEKQIEIPAYAVRKQSESEEFKFFIPFLDSGEVITIDYLEDVLSNNFICKYEYGLLIRKKKNLKTNNKHMILNSGIVVEQASLGSVFGKNFRRSNYIYDSYQGEGTYNDIIINFPANWLQLDVARENITGFSYVSDKNDKRRTYQIGSQIANSLYNQIVQYIQYSKSQTTDIPAICLQDVIQYALDFCGKQKSDEKLRWNLMELKYVIVIEFLDNGLCYKIERNPLQNGVIRILYSSEHAKQVRYKWLEKLHNQSVIKYIDKQSVEDISDIRLYKREIFGLFEEIVNRKDVYINDQIRYRLEHIIKDTQGALRIEGNGKDIFKLLSLFLLDIPDEGICDVSRDRASIIVLLETVFLQYFSVGQEEKQELRMTYDELFRIVGIQINEEIRV